MIQISLVILSNFCRLLRIYEPYKQTYEDTRSYAQPKNSISDAGGARGGPLAPQYLADQ